MCLTTVDKKTKYTKRVIGYKTMQMHSDGTLSACFFGGRRTIGKTYTDRKRKPIQSDSGDEYPTGYHIYLDERDASGNRPIAKVKVRFSEVVASGRQAYIRVVVARRMTILEVRGESKTFTTNSIAYDQATT